jgi:uncharacterized protein involved in exopolysaccharide biosynthesis
MENIISTNVLLKLVASKPFSPLKWNTPLGFVVGVFLFIFAAFLLEFW